MANNLQPLITILEKILNPEQARWILDDHNKSQLESILQKAASLQQILEKSPLPKIGSLESQIRDAAHKAEDIIESHMVDQILSTPEGTSFSFSAPGLEQVVQELDSVMEQALKLADVEKSTSSGNSWSHGAPSSHDPSSKSIAVGLDDDLLQLKDRLTGVQRKLEIVPIVGMGGIGKTTLARNLYQDPSTVSHFHTRAWATVSQDPNMRKILSGLLRCIIGNEVDDLKRSEESELKDALYRRLYGRRYVIVLDDIWSTKFWDEIRRYLPDNNNGSRILLTTRESAVATYADSRSLQHKVQLLNNPESWNLLRKIVFGQGNCPQDLQGAGEKIASGCGGLPLAISVVGGILCNLSRSKDVWEDVADDVVVAISGSGGEFSNILSLSYHHLPNHLKPCFLYMGAFPEDYEIKASRLVRMWVAEGFVKLSNGSSNKSLEEEAENCLKALVERNLVMVRRNKSTGKILSCGIHDLLRDLCIRKGDEEKFLHVMTRAASEVYNIRRVSAPTVDVVNVSPEAVRLARSIICSIWQSPEFLALRLLRVLDVSEMAFTEFPTEIFQLVNLHFLAFTSFKNIPRGISKLLKLQTLIADSCYHDVPYEMWELSELRHLKLNGVTWFQHDCPENFVRNKLQTLSFIVLTDQVIRSGFFESIPNIKKLGCYFQSFPPEGVDLSHLHKLENLSCSSKFKERRGCHVLGAVKFPSNLRKLTLTRCVITPTVLKTLSALPNLEVLRIRTCEFVSKDGERAREGVPEEWEASEEDVFRSLQALHFENLSLVRWIVDETNFPRLRHLRLGVCPKLEVIPSGIGEIPTLQLIEMYECSDSAVASAEEIVQLQESEYDNFDIKLTIYKDDDK